MEGTIKIITSDVFVLIKPEGFFVLCCCCFFFFMQQLSVHTVDKDPYHNYKVQNTNSVPMKILGFLIPYQMIIRVLSETVTTILFILIMASSTLYHVKTC